MNALTTAAESWAEENPGYFYLGHTIKDGLIALLFEYPETETERQVRLFDEELGISDFSVGNSLLKGQISPKGEEGGNEG